MHILFAAPLRILLMKLRIYNVGVHIGLGLFASICGPIIVVTIGKNIKWIEFLIYPGNYIRIGKGDRNNT